MALNPKSALVGQAHYRAGECLIDVKQYGEAVKHFTEAEVIAKANEPDSLTYIFYFQFGSALERHGGYAEAEPALYIPMAPMMFCPESTCSTSPVTLRARSLHR